MHSIRLTLSALVLTALVGCGTMPSLQAARPASAQQLHYGLARSEVVAKTDHMTQHLDEGQSLVYFQNQGGGGVALGLLVCTQVGLGIGNVVLGLPLWVATLHNAGAAALLFVLVSLLARLRPPMD